ncbi:STAS domain-containing protein [Schnuerera sp. xch1]|uniref:STAS domain-containing protein n=1 Tax=Schnuerera sp. xch1 TaxID=2874283 RepID=UPI001CBF7522|nr:STAS domain-containing protein [Schnuerera sp. xch1]MBZ2175707.1 STAS domain-containing protein [Schnuerera sp. xch1]
MTLNINIDFYEEEEFWLVQPEGEVDIYTSPTLKEKLIDALDEKKANVVVDGEKLVYLDSTGLGTLISVLKKAREYDKKVYLKNIKPNIRKLFDITELDKVFIIEE